MRSAHNGADYGSSPCGLMPHLINKKKKFAQKKISPIL